MRILDHLGNEKMLDDLDLDVGFLKEERILIAQHKAIEARDEEGHYEIVKEYPNGGADVKWVVDIPAIEAKEAYDEYETILRYTPFAEKDLDQRKILELKQKLSETDYCIIKIMEGSSTVEEYSDVISERKKWRQTINELENKTYGQGE